MGCGTGVEFERSLLRDMQLGIVWDEERVGEGKVKAKWLFF